MWFLVDKSGGGGGGDRSGGGEEGRSGGGQGGGGFILIFWCGFFGKGLADGAAGGIINPTTWVGSGCPSVRLRTAKRRRRFR